MRRLLFAAVAFMSGVAGGCFLKPAPAPGFRYSCESDADCLARTCAGALVPMADAKGLIEGCDSEEVVADPARGVGYRQTCVAGLCEFACDFYTVQDDCPPASGFNFCLNGRCANTCGTDAYDKYNFDSNDDFCTAPQRCLPIEKGSIDPDLFAGMGGVDVSAFPEGAGFCGIRCDDKDAEPCPAGSYCQDAICLPGCDNPAATPCDEGTICLGYGGLSACLATCDPDGEPCPNMQVCMPSFGICQPSCLGEDAVDCPDGFDCDEVFGYCTPATGATTGDTSEGSSG